jgi:hypothetical protein
MRLLRFLLVAVPVGAVILTLIILLPGIMTFVAVSLALGSLVTGYLAECEYLPEPLLRFIKGEEKHAEGICNEIPSFIKGEEKHAQASETDELP